MQHATRDTLAGCQPRAVLDEYRVEPIVVCTLDDQTGTEVLPIKDVPRHVPLYRRDFLLFGWLGRVGVAGCGRSRR